MANVAPAGSAKSHGAQVARSRGFAWFARSGLFARGVVYAIVGVLAIKLALGDSGKTTDQQGALQTIAKQSFGTALLVAMAIGLAGYASWRLMSAWIDRGDGAKDRISAALSGVAYLILCITAVKIVVGARAGSNDPAEATGGVLDWPAGRYIVGAVGLIIIGEGLAQLYKGLAKTFLEDSRTHEMSRRVRKLFTTLGTVGYLARGVVFALIGYFLARAAYDYDPDKAIALDGALAKLSSLDYGPYLLGLVAAGLIAFAVYAIADSRYRKV